MEFKTKNEFTIIGLEVETSVQETQSTKNKLPKLWQDFMQRIEQLKNLKPGVHYGLCITTNNSFFKYIACSEVDNKEDIPVGMVKHKVPKAMYAIEIHKGKLDKLGETYAKMEQDIKKKGLKENGIWLEMYDKRYKENSNDSEFEIWAALK
jgi:predicted transcriptional regulator YdeE